MLSQLYLRFQATSPTTQQIVIGVVVGIILLIIAAFAKYYWPYVVGFFRGQPVISGNWSTTFSQGEERHLVLFVCEKAPRGY